MKINGQIIWVINVVCPISLQLNGTEILYQEFDGLPRAELHRKGKDGKWTVYNGRTCKYDSDFIYGSYMKHLTLPK